MKLSEVYNKPLKEVIEIFELANLKVYADEHANVKSIELRYIEKEAEPKSKMPITKHHPLEVLAKKEDLAKTIVDDWEKYF